MYAIRSYYVFDVFGSPDAALYAKEGLMLDLTPILDELGLKDKFSDLGPFTYDGKVYGLPRITSYNVCYTKLLRV